MKKTIRDIEYLNGVKVLLRVDYNVSVVKGKIVDDFRICSSLETVDYLCKKGAKVVIISHAENNDEENISLLPIIDVLARNGIKAKFVKEIKSAYETIDREMNNGEVVLLENIRFFPGEKGNDMGFAKELASLGDIYVNEAFPVSHREHASIVLLPQLLPSYIGLQFEREINNLSKAFDPKHPFILILGGAKFETKIPLIEKFINLADLIFVGGAIACDFIRAKGYEIGRSRVSDGKINLQKYLDNPHIVVPEDLVDEGNNIWPSNNFPQSEKIVDIGNQSVETLKEKINHAKMILWNGPLGLYEGGYESSTLEIVRTIARATGENGAVSLLGGGDTITAISKLNLNNNFTFVSTGGGAMLDFLANGTLPGIEAIKE